MACFVKKGKVLEKYTLVKYTMIILYRLAIYCKPLEPIVSDRHFYVGSSQFDLERAVLGRV